jgi:hypothetical protein
MTLQIVPISTLEANAFVQSYHRHNKISAQLAKFSIGASDGERLVGVAIVSLPVARALHDGVTAEVRRCCVLDDAPKGACSFLYSRCWKAWSALGGQKLITYTLQTEPGASLRGAGWRIVGETPGHSKGWTGRPGREWQPVQGQAKFRWEVA